MAVFPIIQKIGSPTTLFTSKGAVKAEVGGIITTYSTTGAADANPYISSYAGAMIVTSADLVYFRNQAASAWVQFGTVTSVGLTMPSLVSGPFLVVSGSPVTTSGTLAVTMATQAIGTVLNNNSGSVAAPIFTTDLVLGNTGTIAGTIQLRSATAGGAPTIQAVGSFGNYNFNLPTSAGTAGQAFLSGGGGASPHTYSNVLLTANNGLTANTATNVQWGGALVQDTTVNAASAYSILFDNAIFTVQGPSNDTGLNPTISGSGTRMFFCPKRAAFRAGYVSDTQWNTANVGYYSIGLGTNTKASGQESFATNGGHAYGISSIGMSSASVATADFSTSISGGQSLGDYSFALGSNVYSRGTSSVGIGYYVDSKSYGGCVVGIFNDTTAAASATTYNALNRAFQIGVGTADGARSNAMTVLFNGKTTLNKYGVGAFTGTAAYALQVDASGNIIEGTPATADIENGTYTPTLTNATNITNSTAYACQYLRVGRVVTVSGKFNITYTTTGVGTRLGISIPEAAAFALDSQCGGVAASNGGNSGNSFAIRADTTNNRAEFYATAIGTGTNETYWFTFTYYIPAS